MVVATGSQLYGTCTDIGGGFWDSDLTMMVDNYPSEADCLAAEGGGGGAGGNTPPTLQNNTINMGSAAVYTFSFTDFGYADAQNNAPTYLFSDLDNPAAGSGTLFIDANDNDIVDAGEAINIGNVPAATNFLNAVNSGTFKFKPSSGNAYEFGIRAFDGTDYDNSFAMMQTAVIPTATASAEERMTAALPLAVPRLIQTRRLISRQKHHIASVSRRRTAGQRLIKT